MKQISFLILFTLFMTTNKGAAQQEMSKMDSISYSVGVMLASNLKQQGLDQVNLEVVMAGLKETIADKAQIDQRMAGSILKQYVTERRMQQEQENAAKGKAFLAENAKKEGVVTLESGLQYKVLQQGTGTIPTSSDRVVVHYHGTLIDGTVFDSSVERGEPATFGVTQVIQGWVEALQLMPTGSKWRLFIPSELAYGSRGTSGLIGPNTALIFDVELIDIK
ncbi:MAG: FKBP-type peptidyl-prolyl cis-trans isomerase [Bacteroidota bacterium]